MVALCCFASINLHGPGYVKAGQLRALAVTGLTRSDALPDLPPLARDRRALQLTSAASV